jgi:hypothetical protein
VTPGVRAVIAYVASRLISRAESSFIFDFSARGHRSMGGTVSETSVNVYDFSESCQLTGQMSNGCFQLFHHGERVHVSIEILGESFSGYDHLTGRHFSGVVNGPKVSINDEGDLRCYAYWCESPQWTRLSGQETGPAEDGVDSKVPEAENPLFES